MCIRNAAKLYVTHDSPKYGRRAPYGTVTGRRAPAQAIICSAHPHITIAQLILKNILHRLYLSRALDVKALINIVMSTTNNFLRTKRMAATLGLCTSLALHPALCSIVCKCNDGCCTSRSCVDIRRSRAHAWWLQRPVIVYSLR